jgi:DNA-binding NarL/FixJ family response regulator
MDLASKNKSMAIILLEDHPLYRDGLENFISKNFPLAKFIYSGDDFIAAKKAVSENKIDIAIVDLHLGDNRPPNELVALFTNKDIPVLVISALNDFESVRSSFAIGAKGFVGKESQVEEILGAISKVSQGLEWINSNLSRALSVRKSPSESLSTQERKALMLYASGLKLDVVARRMDVAPSTAKQYIERAKQKYKMAGIQLRTKTEIYKVLRDEGLVN